MTDQRSTPTSDSPFRGRSWRKGLSEWLWGYDYFVSYHWGSGGVYAVALAQRLRDRGYNVFHDRAEYAMGDDWKQVGERVIRKTQRLVLIATREAVTLSRPVEHEVRAFTSSGRHVVPVVFFESTAGMKRSTLADLDRSEHPVLALMPDSKLYIEDDLANLARGPSDAVVENLTHTYGVMRRRDIRAMVLGALAAILVGFATFSTVSWGIAVARKREAVQAAKGERSQRERADGERDRALANLADANRQTANVFWQLAVKAQDPQQRFGLHSSHLLLRGAEATARIGGPQTTDADRRRLSTDLLAAHFGTSEIVRTWVHDGPVAGVRIGGDGGRVLTWSGARARLHDVSAVEPLRIFEHGSDVKGAEFSRDESRVLVWGGRSLRLWDPSKPAPIQTYTGGDEIDQARMNRDASLILSHSNSQGGDVRLWTDGDSRPVRSFAAEGMLFATHVRFSDDEKLVIASDWNGDVTIWDITRPEPTHRLRLGLDATGVTTRVAFGGGGKYLLTRTSSASARLWDLARPESAATVLPDPEARFTRDGSHILSWGAEGLARLWEVGRPAPVRQFAHPELSGARLSEDEKLLLTWGGFRENGEARLWDVARPEPLKVFRHGNSVDGAAFSPDGRHVLTWGGYDDGGEARLWDARGVEWETTVTKPEMVFGHASWLMHAQFNHDGSRVLTWSDYRKSVRRLSLGDPEESQLDDKKRGCSVHVFDIDRPEPIESFRDEHGVTFCRDQSRAVTVESDRVRVWSERAAEPVQTLAHKDRVRDARFSRDASRVLTWNDYSTAQLWKAGSAAPVQVFEHARWLAGTRFSRDESAVLTWGDRTVNLWRPPGRKPVRSFVHESAVQGARIKGAWLTADERYLLTWTDDRKATLWDFERAAVIRSLDHSSESQPELSDSGRVLTRSARQAQLSEPTGTTPLRTFEAVSGARLARDGSRVLTWDDDGSVRLWDVSRTDPVRSVDCGKGLFWAQFSPDESRIDAWGSDGKVRSWPVDRSGSVRVSNFVSHPARTVFNQTGSRCLTWDAWQGTTVAGDPEARLWDASAPEPIAVFRHQSGIQGARFVAKDSRVLTWSLDKTVRLWDPANREPIVTFHVGDAVDDVSASLDERRLLARTWTKVLAWDCSDALASLTPQERILELEVRTGTALDASQQLRSLSLVEWQARAQSPSYQDIRAKLAARGPTARDPAGRSSQ